MTAKQIERLFALEVRRQLQYQRIRKTDLAIKMKVSRAYLSKLLRGETNMTIETMVKVADAINMNLFLYLKS